MSSLSYFANESKWISRTKNVSNQIGRRGMIWGVKK